MFAAQLCCWAAVLSFPPDWIVKGHLALRQIGSTVHIKAGEISNLDPDATIGTIALRLLKEMSGSFAEAVFLCLRTV